jgi:hypothetical protein
MQIIGITLKEFGSAGMKVTFNKYRKLNSTYATKIKGNEEYDLPLPANIRAEIKGLKYYLLYIMKLWNDDWDKYLTNDLSSIKTESELKKVKGFDQAEYEEARGIFDNSRLEGYRLEKNGFSLFGEIEVVYGKSVKVKLPVIMQDDDFSLYNNCIELIEKINEMVVAYFSRPELSIEDVKETLKLMAGSQMKDEVDKMDDEESYSQLISKLEAKGGLVIIEEGSALEKELEKDNGKVAIASNSSIKTNNVVEHEEVSSETVDESNDDKKPSQDDIEDF